jgi:predicted AAA+ superfamily ATPase
VRVLAGGFPDAVARTSQSRREAWFASYVQAILQRDVRDLANIEQLTEIPNLLQLPATGSATLLNFAELSRTAGIAQGTQGLFARQRLAQLLHGTYSPTHCHPTRFAGQCGRNFCAE